MTKSKAGSSLSSTAKSILRTSREELLRVTDLEEDTLDNVLAVLEAEFADEEEEDEEGDENTPAESAEDNQ